MLCRNRGRYDYYKIGEIDYVNPHKTQAGFVADFTNDNERHFYKNVIILDD